MSRGVALIFQEVEFHCSCISFITALAIASARTHAETGRQVQNRLVIDEDAVLNCRPLLLAPLFPPSSSSSHSSSTLPPVDFRRTSAFADPPRISRPLLLPAGRSVVTPQCRPFREECRTRAAHRGCCRRTVAPPPFPDRSASVAQWRTHPRGREHRAPTCTRPCRFRENSSANRDSFSWFPSVELIDMRISASRSASVYERANVSATRRAAPEEGCARSRSRIDRVREEVKDQVARIHGFSSSN